MRCSSSFNTTISSRNTGSMIRRVTSCVQCCRRETRSWRGSDWELLGTKEAPIPSEARSLSEAVTSLVADERMRQLFITRGHAERDGIDSTSSGSMSPDLGETWRQGFPMSPQWEGGSELDSDNDCEDENEGDDSYEACDSAAESGPKDYISEVSESSLWASIRASLLRPMFWSNRTAGPKWNNAKLYGKHAALWFFLMTKDGSEEWAPVPLPEWPSVCFDFRQNFGFR